MLTYCQYPIDVKTGIRYLTQNDWVNYDRVTSCIKSVVVMHNFSAKKLLLLGISSIVLIAIPTIVFIIGKQQELQSQATPATTLSLTPSSTQASPLQKAVDSTFGLGVTLNPNTSTISNIVSRVQLNIKYDQTKLTPSIKSTCGSFFCVENTTDLKALGDGPTGTPGNLIITVAIADPTKAIQTQTKLGTVYFDAKATTTTPIQVSFSTDTNVTSQKCNWPTGVCQDQPGENVLVTTNLLPAFISITNGTSPTPTVPVQSPTCTGLNVDRTPSGTAPFAVTFTANGNTPNTAINKVTFDFGDGPTQAVTQGNGIGTNSVSIQTSHTYNNPGTYKATATITDNTGAPSTITTSCTQTITVTAKTTTGGGTSGGGTTSGSQSATTAPVAPTAVVQQPSIPNPGPGDTLFIVGTVGGILTIIGTALFFIL